jgi:hypothetical protein
VTQRLVARGVLAPAEVSEPRSFNVPYQGRQREKGISGLAPAPAIAARYKLVDLRVLFLNPLT